MYVAVMNAAEETLRRVGERLSILRVCLRESIDVM